MPSRQNLALHASSAVTQSKWDPLSTSSDGPGGNMQQMLSEANLESMKSIRPVKPSPGMWSGQTSPRLLQLRGAHLLSPRAHQVSGEAVHQKPQCLQHYRSSYRVDSAAFCGLGRLHFHHRFLNSATLIGVTFFFFFNITKCGD